MGVSVRTLAFLLAMAGTASAQCAPGYSQRPIFMCEKAPRHAIETPLPAVGMTLAFSDQFDRLSSTSGKASNGAIWYENLFNGQDFGDCANEHSSGKYSPFAIVPGGLRIRNTFDPAYVDPYGFGRHQYCGVLSSAFPDGSNSMTVSGDGYFDVHVKIPNGSPDGGTWPSFWMLSTNGGGIGGIELDMFEAYGNNPKYLQQATHAYAPAFYPPGPGSGYAGEPDGDLTTDWHTIGMKVTGSGTPKGTVCSYLDEKLTACSPMPQFGKPNDAVKPNWAVMLELASGGGWPSKAPASGFFDYFVDWVAVWKP